jgi:spore coat polysaccharide biosynthesis protein SpsF
MNHEPTPKKEHNEVVAVIIEVRMTSTRLPGKHLLECRGETMISRLIRRIKAIDNVDKIIIATTKNSTDDVFVEIARKEGVEVFRGSEPDVMGRVLDAALTNDVSIICEVTGDCPLIDVSQTQEAIHIFLQNNFDYLNNGLSGLPDGLGCQVFSTSALKNSYNSDITELDKEHVTSHMKRNPKKYRSHYIETPQQLSWPELSLSLDEATDYEVLSSIINEIEPKDPLFGTNRIIEFFNAHPDLLSKNLEIYRRGFE